MATANVETCVICFEEYDSSTHQSVSLPCSHAFCLSCLIRLRTSGKLKCPRCRRASSRVDLPTFPGMEALAAALLVDQEEEEEENVDKKKKQDDRCEKHSIPIDFWVTAKEEFFCKRCAAEDSSRSKLVLIEDAIPQIKGALNTDISRVTKKLEDDLMSLDKLHENLVEKRNCVREFIQAAKILDEIFDQEIGEVSALRAKKLDSSVQMQNIKGTVDKIKDPEDLGAVKECKSTLKKMNAPSGITASQLPQTLLCDIACNYVEQATPGNPPSKAAFVDALLKGSTVAPATASSATFSSSSHQRPRDRLGDRGHVSSSNTDPVEYVWQYQNRLNQ